MRKFWPFMVNFFGYAAFAFVVPLFVLYYQDLGFSGAQIGLLVGIPPLITIFSSPFWTNLADRTQRYHLVWGFLYFLAVLVLLVFPAFQTFPVVLALLIVFNLIIAPFVSFIDTSTMYMLGDEKEMYGRVRLGGTFGFGIFAAVSGGLVQQVGIEFAFYGSAFLFAVGFLFSRRLEFGRPKIEKETDTDFRISSLLKDVRWLTLFSLALASGIGFSATATYFYPYLAELGVQESRMGLAVFVGTMAEIPILFFGNKFFKLARPFTLVVLATLITGLRLIAFGLSVSLTMVMIIQLFNGLTFVLMWMAGVAYADKHAPQNMKATVQGLFGAMNFGVGASIGGFVGGPLLESIGGNGLFLAFGISIVVMTGLVLLIGRRVHAAEDPAALPG